MNVNIKKIVTDVGTIDFIELENKNQMKVTLTSYGAALYQIFIRTNEDELQNVLVAPKDLNSFLKSSMYYGKTVGRMSGRILSKPFELEGNMISIPPYDSDYAQLHGGQDGFSFKHFVVIDHGFDTHTAWVKMRYVSADMESGYPGVLTLNVTYTLNASDTLSITYDAVSTKTTLCNITNHAYFNLSDPKQTNFDHFLKLNANFYLDVDQNYIVKNKKTVENTFYDFRNTVRLGDVIQNLSDTPFKGIDHTFILNQQTLEQPALIAYEKNSDIGLIIKTDYPAIVLYTHNHLGHDIKDFTSNHGVNSSFAAECQFEPGGISYPGLSTSVLKAYEPFNQTIQFQFYKK